MPAVLIGLGFGLVVVLVLVIGGVMLVTSSEFQRDFCNSWVNDSNNAGTPCPFHPPSQ